MNTLERTLQCLREGSNEIFVEPSVIQIGRAHV